MGRVGQSNRTWEVKAMAKFTQMALASTAARDKSNSNSGGGEERRRRRRGNRSNT